MVANGNNTVTRCQNGIVMPLAGKAVGVHAVPRCYKRCLRAFAGHFGNPRRGARTGMNKLHVVLANDIAEEMAVFGNFQRVAATAIGKGNMLCATMPQQRFHTPTSADDKCFAPSLCNGLRHFYGASFHPALLQSGQDLQNGGRGQKTAHEQGVIIICTFCAIRSVGQNCSSFSGSRPVRE